MRPKDHRTDVNAAPSAFQDAQLTNIDTRRYLKCGISNTYTQTHARIPTGWTVRSAAHIQMCMYKNPYYACRYEHAYMHTYIHACKHTQIHMHVHTYIHTYIHTQIHIHIQVLRAFAYASHQYMMRIRLYIYRCRYDRLPTYIL